MRHFLKILSLTGRSTRALITGFILACVSTALSVYVGVGLGQITEKLISVTQYTGSKSSLLYTFLFVTAAYLGVSVIVYIHDLVMIRFRITSLSTLRTNTYDFIFSLPIEFFENNKPGSINQRANNACTAALNWIADFFDSNIFVVLMPLFSAVTLFFYSWIIGVSATLGILVLGYMQIRKVKKREPYQRKANIAAEGIVGFFTEILDHMLTLRTTIDQLHIRKKLKVDVEHQSKAREKQLRVENVYSSWQYFIEGSVIMFTIGITIALAIQSKVSIGGVVAVIGLIRASVGSTRGVGGLYSSFHSAKVEAERFTSLLDERIDHLYEPKKQKRLDKISHLEFRDVSFSYPLSTSEVLKKVSFKVDADTQKLALVGSSGSGKSTIAKLILRLYEPTSGQILINGQDISMFTPASIRMCVGSVMQDAALFHTSIKENISMASPNASDTDIKKSLRIAHADFVASLPKGISTVIGERGVKLSGGQRQRISIARAAVKKPSFILLDEATSALDSNTEKEVQLGLSELMSGKSSLVIAHRLSTISDADMILVLEAGTVKERGTHVQLLEKTKGLYTNLWNAQARYSEVTY